MFTPGVHQRENGRGRRGGASDSAGSLGTAAPACFEVAPLMLSAHVRGWQSWT